MFVIKGYNGHNFMFISSIFTILEKNDLFFEFENVFDNPNEENGENIESDENLFYIKLYGSSIYIVWGEYDNDRYIYRLRFDSSNRQRRVVFRRKNNFLHTKLEELLPFLKSNDYCLTFCHGEIILKKFTSTHNQKIFIKLVDRFFVLSQNLVNEELKKIYHKYKSLNLRGKYFKNNLFSKYERFLEHIINLILVYHNFRYAYLVNDEIEPEYLSLANSVGIFTTRYRSNQYILTKYKPIDKDINDEEMGNKLGYICSKHQWNDQTLQRFFIKLNSDVGLDNNVIYNEFCDSSLITEEEIVSSYRKIKLIFEMVMLKYDSRFRIRIQIVTLLGNEEISSKDI